MHTIQYERIRKKLLLMVKRHAWLFKILNTGRQLVNLLRTYLNKKKKSLLIADFQRDQFYNYKLIFS